MRRIKNSFKRTIKEILFLTALGGALFIYHFLSKIPTSWYFGLISIGTVGFFIFIYFTSKNNSDKYINENGYVVLTKHNELEHRYIAKQILGRDLKQNEVVHHINGKKTDNGLQNLCVMDNQKHEIFHSWLVWKKSKTRRYPSLKEQKDILVKEYGGTLLQNFINKAWDTKQESIPHFISEYKREEVIYCDYYNLDFQNKLLNELKRERKRLADKERIPPYLIFHDKTLQEMVKTLPDKEELMLLVKGVGPEKNKKYGGYFISAIKQLKSEYVKRKDTA